MPRAAAGLTGRRPLVSVVTPVWNAADTLAETIASIRAQSMADWEAWLIDDASDDGSWPLMQALAAEDNRLRLIRFDRRQGAASARNAGIRAARGRHVAFLDADDLWRPQKLERQVAALAAGESFVFSSYLRRNGPGREDRVVPVPERLTYAEALRGNRIGCLTAIYDREVYGEVQMPPLTRRQDYALWLSLLRRGAPALGLPEVLAEYRVRPGSLSSNKIAALRGTWTVLRREEALPFGIALSCFSHCLADALRKRV